MSKPDLDNLIPDFGDYSPDSIWSAPEKPVRTEPASPKPPEESTPEVTSAPEQESISQRARREAQAAFGEALRRYQTPDDTPSSSQPQDDAVPAAIGASSPEEEAAEMKTAPRKGRIRTLFQTRFSRPISEPDKPEHHTEPTPENDPVNDSADEPETAPESTDEVPGNAPESTPEEPAAEDVSTAEPSVDESRSIDPDELLSRFFQKGNGKDDSSTPSLKERFLTPILFFIATIRSRREMQRIEAAQWPDPEEEPLPPELDPKKAAKFYGAHAKPLRLRCRLSLVLTLILTWISLQLPMAGLLGKSLPTQAGICLLLTLTVMLLSLDVITAGFRQLFDLRPGAEALATLSALLCCVDGLLVYAGRGDSLPYSAAACLSLTAALWGQRLTCSARRRTFQAATRSNATVMSTREGQAGARPRILRSPLAEQSIVRRTESDDIAQSVYFTAAPILILAALILALIASLNGRAVHFLHMFSALITVSTAASAFFLFSLPYALAARRLLPAGAALLGWAGMEEFGRRPELVITDDDIFPPDDDILQGSIHFSSIYLPSEADTSTILSYTCSIMAAAEGSLARVFRQFAQMRGIPLLEVEDFTVRESGGYSGTVDGNTVYVGNYAFMKLLRVDIPRDLNLETAFYTAVHGEMAAAFLMEYKPSNNVQNALIMFLRGRTHATFALENFCLSPRMLARMFRLSSDRLPFSASFLDRCRQARETTQSDTAAALYTLSDHNRYDGFLSAMDLSETGRRLHTACRISAAITLASSVLGMVILFLLFRAGAFAPAGAGNLTLYMALWALPVIILSVGQSR